LSDVHPDVTMKGSKCFLCYPEKDWKEWMELNKHKTNSELRKKEELAEVKRQHHLDILDLKNKNYQEVKELGNHIRELEEKLTRTRYERPEHRIQWNIEDSSASQMDTATPLHSEEDASSSGTRQLTDKPTSPPKRQRKSKLEFTSRTAGQSELNFTVPSIKDSFKKEEVSVQQPGGSQGEEQPRGRKLRGSAQSGVGKMSPEVQKTSRHTKARDMRGYMEAPDTRRRSQSTGLAKDGSTFSSRLKADRTKSTDRALGRDVGKHNATATRNRSSSANAPAQQNRPVQLMRHVSPNAAPTIYNFNPHSRAPSTHRLQLAPTYTAPRRSEGPPPNPRRSI